MLPGAGGPSNPVAGIIMLHTGPMTPGRGVMVPSGGGGGGGFTITPTAWSASDKTAAASLTNGNLTATSTGSAGSGRAVVAPASGKLYWEFTFVTVSQISTSGGFGATGAALPINLTAAGATGLGGGGGMFVNGASQTSLGARSNGDIIGVAVDIDAKVIWYRLAPAGNWNNSGTANPATGAGGFSISALTFPIVPTYYLSTVSGQAVTANFGATAFSGAVPSGFSSGCCGP